MADILKVTAPLVSKFQAPEAKRNVELAAQFPLQDTSRVTRPGPQTELLSQNNGMTQQEETSALLLNLLKDPSVTVSFLKNISAMEAVIKLLPANNSPFTQEIEQLFEQLLISPDQIAAEMSGQEKGSTFFKGPLFELVREALRQNPEQQELKESSVAFLKSLTLFLTRREALGSVSNSLSYLAGSLASSKTLSTRLTELAARYKTEDAPHGFGALKQETLELLRDVEESILFSPKMAKVVKMAVYNLSRYNNNGDFLQEATARMLNQLHGDAARERFLGTLEAFLNEAAQPRPRDSSVMEVLTRILGRQTENQELMALSSDQVEKIIHSLLSSPCNFTPLLHFVIPVQYENLQSFAEIWINPNGEEDDRGHSIDGHQTVHMLLVFDISGIGRFELELFVRDKLIDFALYCPPAYAEAFKKTESELRGCTEGSGYRFQKVTVERLERSRSLMDVFRSLPYKRTGVDVKV